MITLIIVMHLDVERTSCEIPVDSWSASVCDNVYNNLTNLIYLAIGHCNLL